MAFNSALYTLNLESQCLVNTSSDRTSLKSLLKELKSTNRIVLTK